MDFFSNTFTGLYLIREKIKKISMELNLDSHIYPEYILNFGRARFGFKIFFWENIDYSKKNKDNTPIRAIL